MRKNERDDPERWFDPEGIRRTLALSPAQRLRLLEELNKLLDAFTPPEKKRIWEKMKAKGW